MASTTRSIRASYKALSALSRKILVVISVNGALNAEDACGGSSCTWDESGDVLFSVTANGRRAERMDPCAGSARKLVRWIALSHSTFKASSQDEHFNQINPGLCWFTEYPKANARIRYLSAIIRPSHRINITLCLVLSSRKESSPDPSVRTFEGFESILNASLGVTRLTRRRRTPYDLCDMRSHLVICGNELSWYVECQSPRSCMLFQASSPRFIFANVLWRPVYNSRPGKPNSTLAQLRKILLILTCF